MDECTLPYRVKQEHDGKLPIILATFRENLPAYAFLDSLTERMIDDEGPQPAVWIEVYQGQKGWVPHVRYHGNEIKKDMFHATEQGRYRRELIFRRVTAGEQRFIVRCIEEFIDGQEGAHQRSARQYALKALEQFNDGNTINLSKLEEVLLGPWDKIDRAKNLLAYIRSRNIIIESYLTIPDQF